jgi:hypothetical protein
MPGLGQRVDREFCELDERVQEYESWRCKDITEENELDFRIAVDCLKGTLYDLAKTLTCVAGLAREGDTEDGPCFASLPIPEGPADVNTQSMKWDVFISYASEDEEAFVRPLAEALLKENIRVWFAELTLTVGDSLRRSIDHGLASSRYGIVVISPSFLAKEWPQKELDGLAAREVDGRKVILPVWHNIDAETLRRRSPLLADRVATSTAKGVQAVVADLMKAMR